MRESIDIVGGSWNYYPRLCRSAFRIRFDPGYRSNRRGFRTLLIQEDTTMIPFTFLSTLPGSRFYYHDGAEYMGHKASMQDTPVTRRQWKSIVDRYPESGLNPDPACFKSVAEEQAGADPWELPVESVSFLDVIKWLEFANKALKEDYPNKNYRFVIPTSYLWELYCRAGTTTAFNVGDTLTEKDANFNNSVGQTTVVRSYAPNAWGLYDMHGNVGEAVCSEVELQELCPDIFSVFPNKVKEEQAKLAQEQAELEELLRQTQLTMQAVQEKLDSLKM